MAYSENNATQPSWGLDLAEPGKRCYLKEYIISLSADVFIIGKVICIQRLLLVQKSSRSI